MDENYMSQVEVLSRVMGISLIEAVRLIEAALTQSEPVRLSG